MSDQQSIPSATDLQGQIDALKQILLFVVDALADRKIDILELVQSRISVGPVPDFVLGWASPRELVRCNV